MRLSCICYISKTRFYYLPSNRDDVEVHHELDLHKARNQLTYTLALTNHYERTFYRISLLARPWKSFLILKFCSTHDRKWTRSVPLAEVCSHHSSSLIGKAPQHS